MPKTSIQCKKIKEDRVNNIIVTATKIFATGKYSNITIDSITDACNCSHGLFYHYFKNKEEIFDAVMKRSIETLFQYINLEKISSLSTYDALIDIIDSFLNMFKQDDDYLTCVSYLIFNLRLQKDDLPKPKITGNKKPRKINELIFSLIEKGQKENIFIDGDPKEFTIAIIALLKGLAYNRLFVGSKKFLCRRKETIINMVSKK